jgi:hypothetical protein
MNLSSDVVVSSICSVPRLTAHSSSPQSCQSDHSTLGLDLVVSIVPPTTSVSPLTPLTPLTPLRPSTPLTLNLIILHHDNYLLPLTFSLLRFLAVSRKMTVQKYLSFCAHFLTNKIINSFKIK